MSELLTIYSSFGLSLPITANVKCEIYVDTPKINENESKKIFLQIEPNEISGVYDYIIKNHKKYDLVLCWSDEILKTCENSVFLPYGDSWIDNYDFTIPKKFSVSSLIGNKLLTENHGVRHKLINLPSTVTNIGFDLYNSRNSPKNILGLKTISEGFFKDELFYNQFHICIENFSQKNWFTEKIVDCFRTKTVPIYIGCPNIGDFFDVNGIMLVNSFEHLVETLSRIDENTYQSMIDSIENNYNLSEKYINYRKNLGEKILDFLNK
jgi:hypothetical protein